MTAPVWVINPQNLHCPTCDTQLIAPAARFEPLGRTEPTYVIDGNKPMRCPAGHELPDTEVLFAYSDQRGYPPEARILEVPPPR